MQTELGEDLDLLEVTVLDLGERDGVSTVEQGHGKSGSFITLRDSNRGIVKSCGPLSRGLRGDLILGRISTSPPS